MVSREKTRRFSVGNTKSAPHCAVAVPADRNEGMMSSASNTQTGNPRDCLDLDGVVVFSVLALQFQVAGVCRNDAAVVITVATRTKRISRATNSLMFADGIADRWMLRGEVVTVKTHEQKADSE